MFRFSLLRTDLICVTNLIELDTIANSGSSRLTFGVKHVRELFNANQ